VHDFSPANHRLSCGSWKSRECFLYHHSGLASFSIRKHNKDKNILNERHWNMMPSMVEFKAKLNHNCFTVTTAVLCSDKAPSPRDPLVLRMSHTQDHKAAQPTFSALL
jgi:hypothetical protein